MDKVLNKKINEKIINDIVKGLNDYTGLEWSYSPNGICYTFRSITEKQRVLYIRQRKDLDIMQNNCEILPLKLVHKITSLFMSLEVQNEKESD